VICLNKALFLTRGNPVGLTSLLPRLNPSSTSYTAVLEPPDGGSSYFSQVLHQAGSRSAHFSFFTPDFAHEDKDFSSLIDFLCFQAGEMGALNILAEIEESHPFFELLRDTGFCVYSWESVWRLPTDKCTFSEKTCWQIPDPVDENGVRTLYQTLVPPLVQNAEPFTNGGSPRMVYKRDGDMLAYMESMSGVNGIYLMPVIHPSVENIQLLLEDLVCQFKGLGKPVYLQVRSYQAWLSEGLTTLKADPSPRFAILVKHLAVNQYSKVTAAQRSRSDQRQAEPTTPILQNCGDTTPTIEVSK
jgi:hypothetical protein